MGNMPHSHISHVGRPPGLLVYEESTLWEHQQFVIVCSDFIKLNCLKRPLTPFPNDLNLMIDNLWWFYQIKLSKMIVE